MVFFCSIFVFRGRHASKLTEEEEDETYLKEEEDGLAGSGSGHTRLLVQPSCKISTLFCFRNPKLPFSKAKNK